jgi:hypothetical protein
VPSLAQVLAQTVARVRACRDNLNDIDDELNRAIQHVEAALSDIRPGVPIDVQYAARHEGELPQWLSFQKHNGAWRIMHAYGDGEQQSPLLSASREVRADVFDPRRVTSVAPIVALIEEMPRAIEVISKDREAALLQARALCEGLATLGFGRPAA